jgi:hypothetical protein
MRVQTLKEQITQQEEIMEKAKLAKEKALQECTRIDNEMADFHNNKDTKLDEMNVSKRQ